MTCSLPKYQCRTLAIYMCSYVCNPLLFTVNNNAVIVYTLIWTQCVCVCVYVCVQVSCELAARIMNTTDELATRILKGDVAVLQTSDSGLFWHDSCRYKV